MNSHPTLFTHIHQPLESLVPSKVFSGDDLRLTGLEISVTTFAPGTGSTFVHGHHQNEELYIILSGDGVFHVSGDEFPVQAGSLIRVSPAGLRALRASDAGPLTYLCIQAQAGSLEQKTRNDGFRADTPTSWLPSISG